MWSTERSLAYKLWAPVVVVLVIAALFSRSAMPLVAATAILALVAISVLWRHYALTDLTLTRSLDPTRLFPGEETQYTLSLTNQKLLPVPWLTVTERFPAALAAGIGDAVWPTSRERQVTQPFTLGPFERVHRSVTLRATRRGFYQIAEAQVAAGDPFGLAHAEATMGTVREVVVYPALLPAWAYDLRAHQMIGDYKAERRLWDDPARLAGVRPYESGDPPRRIHWRATAHTGMLQTKVFDPGADVQVILVVDCGTTELAWSGIDHELLERAVSVTATMARDTLDTRVPVGLLSNALTVNTGRHIRLMPGRSPDQLAAILELLARLIPYYLLPIERLLERELPTLPFGATLVLVSAAESEELSMTLETIRAHGHKIYRCDPRHAEGAAPLEERAW